MAVPLEAVAASCNERLGQGHLQRSGHAASACDPMHARHLPLQLRCSAAHGRNCPAFLPGVDLCADSM